MAESGGPLSNGGPPVNVLQTVDQLSKHVKEFQKLINLDLLIPSLVEHEIITADEQYCLMNSHESPQNRILSLVTMILPSKGNDIVKVFKMALEDTLKNKGHHGHEDLLEKYFGVPPKVYSGVDSDGSHLTAADAISDESEEFSLLIMKFRKFLETGTEKAVAQRLKDVSNYLCRLRDKKHNYVFTESVRTKLDSNDLTFSKLLSCLDSSNPPVISDSDVSILHKIVDKVLELDDGNKKIIIHLNHLLNEYEEAAGIAVSKTEPQISAGKTRITAKVVNAHRSSAKLKNGVKKSFWESLKFNFRGSGIGSVIFYWDVPEECTHQLVESFENVCHNEVELHQLRITKVEVQLNQKPFQITLDMEITDPVLLEAAQKQALVADVIAPEQEEFILLLIKIDHLIGNYAELFLSTSRKEYSRPYAQFERSSFKEMTDILIIEDKLHCFDISYIQQFLLSLLRWDTSQGSEHKELIIGLLKEAQDYEPVPTGSPLPSVQLHGESHTTFFVTHFANISCVSYELMMILKYALSQLLCLSLSTFQYVSSRDINRSCQLTWKTCPENFEKIEHKLSYHTSTAALALGDDFEINYPNEITFSCIIKNMQIVLDGSPVLYPELDGKILYTIILYIYCEVL